MNIEAVRFNENNLRTLSEKQKDELLKCNGLKRCINCGYLMFQVFGICLSCEEKQK